jgi:hypothetical protein
LSECAAGSICIGLLLIVAYLLAGRTKGLLLEEAAPADDRTVGGRRRSRRRITSPA